MKLISARQVAEQLAIGRSAAYELVRNHPRRVYIRRSLRLPQEVLDAFVAAGGDKPWSGPDGAAGAPASKAEARWMAALHKKPGAPRKKR